MSWKGDRSDIINKWEEDPEYFMLKYHRGIDQFIYENIKFSTYNDKSLYYSFREMDTEEKHPVCLFNQRYQNMKDKGWWSNYLL